MCKPITNPAKKKKKTEANMLNTTLTLLSSRNKFSTKYMFKPKQINIHKAYFKKKKKKKKHLINQQTKTQFRKNPNSLFEGHQELIQDSSIHIRKQFKRLVRVRPRSGTRLVELGVGLRWLVKEEVVEELSLRGQERGVHRRQIRCGQGGGSLILTHGFTEFPYIVGQ